MTYSPVLVFHASCGVLGLLSGAAALSFHKGSRWHVLTGKVFVASMLVMAAGAVYLGATKHQPGNISGGIFTFYLILTAWLTARRADGDTGKLDWAALLIPLVLGTLTWFSGVEKMRTPGPPKDGVPAGMNFFMGCVMVLAAAGDIRMLVGGGILGAKRIPRHLWRMCFGLFIATGSFLAQRRVIAFLGGPKILLLAVLPLILMIFWLIRVRFKNVYKAKAIPRNGALNSAIEIDS